MPPSLQRVEDALQPVEVELALARFA